MPAAGPSPAERAVGSRQRIVSRLALRIQGNCFLQVGQGLVGFAECRECPPQRDLRFLKVGVVLQAGLEIRMIFARHEQDARAAKERLAGALKQLPHRARERIDMRV